MIAEATRLRPKPLKVAYLAVQSTYLGGGGLGGGGGL